MVIFHTLVIPASVPSLPKIFSDILLKALLTHHGITYQVVAKCPLGEQDNIMLSRLLDLWQVSQMSKFQSVNIVIAVVGCNNKQL